MYDRGGYNRYNGRDPVSRDFRSSQFSIRIFLLIDLPSVGSITTIEIEPVRVQRIHRTKLEAASVAASAGPPVAIGHWAWATIIP